jgi:hypothetical protein
VEIIAGGLRVQVRPEAIRDLLAPELVIGRERQEFDETFGFVQPPGPFRDHSPAARRAKAAEEGEPQRVILPTGCR